MKKVNFRSINKICTLGIALILTASFVSCSCKDSERQLSFTKINLLKNGNSPYSVLVPGAASDEITLAASELVTFFREVSGVTLPIVKDSEMTEGAKYFSIGETALFKSTGEVLDKAKLTRDGFRIFVKDEHLFMAGGGGKGNIYAVYEFLELNFGVKFFAEDEILTPKVTDMKLLDFNETVIPHIATRAYTTYKSLYHDPILRTRMRLNGHNESWIYFSHSTFLILPKEVYFNEHRDWYSTDGTQLCFTNEEMTEEFIKITVELVANNPDSQFIMLGLEDINTFCSCERCKPLVDTIKESGVVIRFVNKVAKAVEDWINENSPGREFTVVTYAYQKTEAPPVAYDSKTNKYLPLDESVKPRDNVAIMFAPLYSDFSHSLLDEEYNPASTARLSGWRDIGNVFARYYGAQFGYYFVPFNNWVAVKENYRILYEMGAPYCYNQGAHVFNSGNFQEMVLYVHSRLMWDTSRSARQLIEEFIANYYKQAGDAVQEYFDLLQAHYAMLFNDKSLLHIPSMSVRDSYMKPEIYPRELIKQFDGIFEKAFAAIEPLRTENPDLYDILELRLRTERLTPIYFKIILYSGYYGKNELSQMINEFEEVTSMQGIGYWAEPNTREDRAMSLLITGWKNSLL
jgi:hypothetical protein